MRLSERLACWATWYAQGDEGGRVVTYVRSFSGDGRLVNLGLSYMPMVVGDQVVIVHTGQVSEGRVIAAPQDLPRRPGDWSGPGDVVPGWSVLGFGQHRLASGRTDWIVIWGGVAAGPTTRQHRSEESLDHGHRARHNSY